MANSLNKKTYLLKCQTVLAKLELPTSMELHHRTAFVQASIVGYSLRFRKQSSVKCGGCIITRLAAIDGVGGDTGVKPQHRLRHVPTAAPSLTIILIFFIVIKII